MHHLLGTQRFWSHVPRLAVAFITCLALSVASVGRAEGLKEINPPADPVLTETTALVGGRLIDGRGGPPIEKAVVIVRG